MHREEREGHEGSNRAVQKDEIQRKYRKILTKKRDRENFLMSFEGIEIVLAINLLLGAYAVYRKNAVDIFVLAAKRQKFIVRELVAMKPVRYIYKFLKVLEIMSYFKLLDRRSICDLETAMIANNDRYKRLREESGGNIEEKLLMLVCRHYDGFTLFQKVCCYMGTEMFQNIFLCLDSDKTLSQMMRKIFIDINGRYYRRAWEIAALKMNSDGHNTNIKKICCSILLCFAVHEKNAVPLVETSTETEKQYVLAARKDVCTPWLRTSIAEHLLLRILYRDMLCKMRFPAKTAEYALIKVLYTIYAQKKEELIKNNIVSSRYKKGALKCVHDKGTGGHICTLLAHANGPADSDLLFPYIFAVFVRGYTEEIARILDEILAVRRRVFANTQNKHYGKHLIDSDRATAAKNGAVPEWPVHKKKSLPLAAGNISESTERYFDEWGAAEKEHIWILDTENTNAAIAQYTVRVQQFGYRDYLRNLGNRCGDEELVGRTARELLVHSFVVEQLLDSPEHFAHVLAARQSRSVLCYIITIALFPCQSSTKGFNLILGSDNLKRNIIECELCQTYYGKNVVGGPTKQGTRQCIVAGLDKFIECYFLAQSRANGVQTDLSTVRAEYKFVTYECFANIVRHLSEKRLNMVELLLLTEELQEIANTRHYWDSFAESADGMCTDGQIAKHREVLLHAVNNDARSTQKAPYTLRLSKETFVRYMSLYTREIEEGKEETGKAVLRVCDFVCLCVRRIRMRVEDRRDFIAHREFLPVLMYFVKHLCPPPGRDYAVKQCLNRLFRAIAGRKTTGWQASTKIEEAATEFRELGIGEAACAKISQTMCELHMYASCIVLSQQNVAMFWKYVDKKRHTRKHITINGTTHAVPSYLVSVSPLLQYAHKRGEALEIAMFGAHEIACALAAVAACEEKVLAVYRRKRAGRVQKGTEDRLLHNMFSPVQNIDATDVRYIEEETGTCTFFEGDPGITGEEILFDGLRQAERCIEIVDFFDTKEHAKKLVLSILYRSKIYRNTISGREIALMD